MKPIFNDKLHVGRPNQGNRNKLLERINYLLDKNWLTNNGPFVKKFEKEIANLVQAKHCIATCNATIGLELAIRALDLKGEVIIPSFTFIATAHALQWQEITPVFCDIDPDTHTIDPSKIEALITPRTSGIIGVHTWGTPCNIEELTKIAQKNQLFLMYDAAHALGCSYQGKMIGNFGEAEVFSFHATKFINSFEGGAIVTNNDDLAHKIRLMQNFGFEGLDNVTYIGTNGKMSEVSAAMGITSLESLEYFREANKTNYYTYKKELMDVKGLSLYLYNENESNNYQYVVTELNKKHSKVTRDELVNILHEHNVIARKYFYPGCHKMEPYRSYYPHSGLLLNNTEYLVEKVIVLPTGTSIGETEIMKICQIIKKYVS